MMTDCVVNVLGQRLQPHTLADGAPSLGEQWPYLTIGTRDGGAVHTELARQHIMSDSMAQMHERRQKSVERQSVLRTHAHHPLPWPGRELGLVSLVPQRTDLSGKLILCMYRPIDKQGRI